MNDTKRNLKDIRDERALNVLFAPNQIAIIKKILTVEKLTKIESEVYSRIIKPKLNAIIDAHEVAIIARTKE